MAVTVVQQLDRLPTRAPLGLQVQSLDEDRRHTAVAEIESRLCKHSYAALRRVRVMFHEGIVTLSGRLPSYYLKQLAQTAVRGVTGVEGIANQIEVVY
jgi:osmotically-inducible protein OsmY